MPDPLIFVPVGIVLVIAIVYFLRSSSESDDRKSRSYSEQNAELIRVLLNLEDEPREQLFKLYAQQFGNGPARYARDTFTKWKAGTVKPNKETFRRFLLHLPRVMTFDLKCEVLREFREAYCAQDKYSLTVYTDNWKEQLGPLVESVIEKAKHADLPSTLRGRLAWLAEDDVEIANELLARSQEQQSRAAMTLLDAEFANIQDLLDNAKGDRKVIHDLQLPLGTISLKIKRR